MTNNTSNHGPRRQLTAQERDELIGAVASLGVTLARFTEAIRPTLIAVGQQLAALYSLLQEAGLIDADGNPVPFEAPAEDAGGEP